MIIAGLAKKPANPTAGKFSVKEIVPESQKYGWFPMVLKTGTMLILLFNNSSVVFIIKEHPQKCIQRWKAGGGMKGEETPPPPRPQQKTSARHLLITSPIRRE